MSRWQIFTIGAIAPVSMLLLVICLPLLEKPWLWVAGITCWLLGVMWHMALVELSILNSLDDAGGSHE